MKNYLSDSNSSTAFRQFEPPRTPKRFVEECFKIRVGSVQQRFGKRRLLDAIRYSEPIKIPVSYNPPFTVWLTYDVHQLVGKPGKWSSLERGTARIWFVCPGCQRKVAKLHYFVYPGTIRASQPFCRQCGNLTYLSVNSSGNRFYKKVIKPSRRLQRVKERLWSGRRLPWQKRKELEHLKDILEGYIPQAVVKYGRKEPRSSKERGWSVRSPVSSKRPYKNLDLA